MVGAMENIAIVGKVSKVSSFLGFIVYLLIAYGIIGAIVYCHAFNVSMNKFNEDNGGGMYRQDN